jgi:hypothetical protein
LSTYAVLSSSSITDAGSSTVCGGVIGAPSITGDAFVCGSNGTTIDTADVSQAEIDLTAAIASVGAMTGGAALPADLGGYTIYPGLYTSSSALEISANGGIVTLAGDGIHPNVFIFQVSTALTTASATGTTPLSQVVLGSGVTPDDVYWVVGAATTLGTYSVFQGNILSYAAITVGGYATVNGRALCQTAVDAFGTYSTLTMP